MDFKGAKTDSGAFGSHTKQQWKGMLKMKAGCFRTQEVDLKWKNNVFVLIYLTSVLQFGNFERNGLWKKLMRENRYKLLT